jgi:hypothetical protein
MHTKDYWITKENRTIEKTKVKYEILKEDHKTLMIYKKEGN